VKRVSVWLLSQQFQIGVLTLDASSIVEWAGKDACFPIEDQKYQDSLQAIDLAREDLIELGVPVPEMGMCN